MPTSMGAQDVDHQLRPGVYQIYNFVSGTVLDLSGADRKSIIGFPAHQGPNQKWEISPLGKGYSMRSVFSGDYLTVETGIRNGVPVVANPYPVSWALEAHDLERGIWRWGIPLSYQQKELCEIFPRIRWPNSPYLFDLSGKGDSKPGSMIQLWEGGSFEPCRLWLFKQEMPSPEVVSFPRAVPACQLLTSPVSSLDAIDSDSITHIEGNGDFTITTTTTTVTKIARVYVS